MCVYSSGEEARGTLGRRGGLKARRLIMSIRNFSSALFSRAKTSEFSATLLSGRFYICPYNGNVQLINLKRNSFHLNLVIGNRVLYEMTILLTYLL